MATNEVSLDGLDSPAERVDSERECEMLIEALSKELSVVRDHLAFLTHQLCEGKPPTDQGKSPTPPPQPSPKPLSSLKRRKPKKKPPPSPDSIEHETAERVKYLAVVDRVEETRASARRQCLLVMQEHIQSQLEAVKKRGEHLKRRLAKRERKIRAARVKLKPARFRSTGANDHSFLGNVYLSNFYRIIEKEQQLMRAGQIRTLTEVQAFWEHMLTPLMTPTPSSPHQSVGNDDVATEDDEEDYTNSWALTALQPESRSKTPYSAGPLFADEELEYVPTVLPKLRSVSDFLDEGKEIKKEILLRLQPYPLPSADRQRVSRMYQQSRANEMAMRRFLPLSLGFDASPLCLLPSLECSERPRAPPSSIPQPPSPLNTTTPDSVTTKASYCAYSRDTGSLKRRAAGRKEKAPVPVTNQTVIITAPLTMDSALQQGERIIEPKCKSSLWTNPVVAQR